MSLIVIGVLHKYNSEIKSKESSDNYINVTKKILQMYKIKSGCLINGRIDEINSAVDRDKQIEVAMPNLESISGMHVDMIYVEGEGEKDYLFFQNKDWNKLVNFAIFPEEYEIKFEFSTISCGFRKIKLFNKGIVIDK